MANRSGRFSRWATTVVFALAVAGCAAPTAFREGNALASDGRHAEALARFEQAMRLEPGSGEYRIAYLRSRDRLIAEALAAADQSRERGDFASAEAGYRQVLSMAGANDRAIGGLRAIDSRRRWDELLKSARSAAERKDWVAVRAAIKPVLQERPGDADALELQRQAERAAEAVPRADKGLAAAYRKPISIEFRDTPLRTVFEVIARTSGLNFVFDKDIRTDQRTSIYLKDSTIEAAVAMLLASNQLDQKVLDANSILIYPNTAPKQREHQSLVVRSFYLTNADAKTVGATLKTLLKSRDVVVDEKLNLVILRDSPEVVRVAERLVALHDVPEAEVMLEVEILEVKRTRLLDLGVRWPDQLTLTPLPAATGGSLTLADLRSLNSGSLQAAVGGVTINARKTDGDANILANPRIRARNREKARIHIGERVPNITSTATSTGFVSESINYVDVGLKLDVEPTVYLDNEVAIKVSLEVSNIISQVPTKAGTLAYQIGTRTATTVLRLKDGENQVLAGLINDEDRRTGNKVPGLGEVPVLGRLFGSQLDDAAKTEIVLSITPRVLRNVQRPEASMLEFDSGTESNARSPGGDSAPAIATPALTPSRPAGTPRPPGTAAGEAAGAAQSALPASTSTATSTSSSAAPVVIAAGSQQGTVSTRWQGPSSAKVGDALTVNLFAQADQPVSSMPVVVGFDPKVLQVVSVREGDFMRQGGAQTTFASQVDAAGQVRLTAARGGVAGASTEAVLAALNFRVIGGAGADTRLVVQSLSPQGLLSRAMVGQPAAPLVLTIAP